MPLRTSHVASSQNRDATGRQHWRVVVGGITAARKALAAAKTKRDRQTGDRTGEVLGLTWADVDVPGRTLRIERQGKRRDVKTKRSRRAVAMTPDLAAHW